MPANGHEWPGLILSIGLIAVCLGIAVWDIYAAYQVGWQHTVSATMQRWSMTWPVLPFILGIIAGHIFWPTIPPPHR